MPAIRIQSAVLGCILAGATACSQPVGADVRPTKAEELWVIAADGLGSFRGSKKTAADLRRIFPDADVVLERDPTRGDEKSGQGRYVVRRDGEVLFTAPCGCHLFDGRWVVNQPTFYGSIDEVVLRPNTRNGRYKTPEGIGVGSTLLQLRQAYSSQIFDLFVARQFGDEPPLACILRKANVRQSTSSQAVEELAFSVDLSPSAEKRLPASPVPIDPRQIAPDARITEIATSGRCGARIGLGIP